MKKNYLGTIHLFLFVFIFSSYLPAQPERLVLTLSKTIDYGLEHAMSIRSAQAFIEQQQGLKKQVTWLSNPQFELNLEEIPFGNSLGSANEKQLVMEQSIPFPLKMYTRFRMHSRFLESTEYNLAAVKIKVTTDIKIAYSTILYWRDRIDLAKRSLELAGDFQKKTQLRYEVGEASYLESLRGKVEKANAEQHLKEMQTEFQKALSQLKFTLGLDQTIDVVLQDSLIFRPVQIKGEELLVSSLVMRHPDYLGIQKKVEGAKLGKSLVKQGYLPDIDIHGMRQKVGGNSRLFGIGIGFTFPLWFFSNQSGQIQEATGILRQLETEAINQQLMIQAAIKSSYVSVQNEQSRVSTYTQEILLLAEEGLRVARRSFMEGEIGYIEFLEAQRSYFTTKADYLEAVLKYTIARAELEQAIGKEIE